jgi:hypothetical protein
VGRDWWVHAVASGGQKGALRARASQRPAWSGYSTVTFGSCVAGSLVSTNQGNGTWGPGAGT